jgi:hypothetical protein
MGDPWEVSTIGGVDGCPDAMHCATIHGHAYNIGCLDALAQWELPLMTIVSSLKPFSIDIEPVFQGETYLRDSRNFMARHHAEVQIKPSQQILGALGDNGCLASYR